MGNTIIAPVLVQSGSVIRARELLVNGLGKTGELIEGYAVALTAEFGAGWHGFVGADAKGIKAERKLFNEEMGEVVDAKGKPRFLTADGKPTATLNTYWQRVKEAAGYQTAESVSGSTSNSDRNLADLKTIINRILADEENGVNQSWSDDKGALMGIFTDHGGDIGKLGK